MTTKTLSIGGYSVNMKTDETDDLQGDLDIIGYTMAGVPLFRICSSSDELKGARIVMSGGDQWEATIDGKITLLDSIYSRSLLVTVAHNRFDIPIPAIKVGKSDDDNDISLGGRIAYGAGKFTVTCEGTVGMPYEVMGFDVEPELSIALTGKVNTTSLDVSLSMVVSAGLLGAKISSPSISIPVPITSLSQFVELAGNAIMDKVIEVIAEYLLRWANAIKDVVEDAAEYVENVGEAIVDAVGDAADDLFGGGSDGPPPPMLANAFADAMPLGDVMVQWGQQVVSSDSARTYTFAPAFGGACSAAVTNTARGSVKSALAISSRTPQSFKINRDSAIDGMIPFHWIALGGAPDKTVAIKGRVILGDVVLQWGKAESTIDGTQTFTLESDFGAGPIALVTNTDAADIRCALNVTSVNAANGTFTINRDAALDGAVPFTYLAIGPAPGKTITTPVLAVEDFVLQWGTATSTSDGEQLFAFPRPFRTMNFAVVTAVHNANVKSALSQTRPINPSGFILHRDAVFDGSQPFYWIAAGR